MTLTLAPEQILGLGVPELVIILVVVLLLFGGSRLAGLGKSTGRALKEFKEETKDLRDKDGKVIEPPTTTDPRTTPQVTNGEAGSKPPMPQTPIQQTPPHTVPDPSATDARKDV